MTPSGPERPLGPRYWITLVGASASAALLVALIHASPASTPMLFGRVLLRSLVCALTMAALSGSVVPLVIRFIAPRRSVGRWALLVGTLLVLAVAATFLANVIAGAMGLAQSGLLTERFRDDLRVMAIVSVALGVGMSLFGTLRADLEAATAALHARELEQERTRKLAAEARLASLEARLHPHFLFNALNTISALIEEDPARAERMVERLAALLRVALDAGRRGLVPLGEEMALVGDYLEIEKARFGDRLTYAIDVDPEAKACAVPPLAVQTLVENSVKHVVAPRPAGGRVRVEARAEDGRVLVRVWDDGPGFALDGGAPGHGLDTLTGRLAERFGGHASLGVERADGGTLVVLTLPRSVPALAAGE